MNHQVKDRGIPVMFYGEFFEDFSSLPESVQEALGMFLGKLQQNPENAALLGNVHTNERHPDLFAYLFAPDYAVYWELVRSESPFVQLNAAEPVRIDVLEVRKL